jgi:hypothetical protein
MRDNTNVYRLNSPRRPQACESVCETVTHSVHGAIGPSSELGGAGLHAAAIVAEAKARPLGPGHDERDEQRALHTRLLKTQAVADAIARLQRLAGVTNDLFDNV